MSFHYIPFQFSALPRVHCAFQMRSNKKSSKEFTDGSIAFTNSDSFETIRQNRHSMQEELGISKFAELKQIHSDIMVFNPQVTGLDEINSVEADGMATRDKKLALIIKTADCQSILIAHKDSQHIMGIHAGWRGNRMNFPASSVEKFCENYKLKPQDLFAVRGPSLGPNMAEFTNFEKEWSEEFRPWYNEKNKCMNLWELTKQQLLSAGLLKNNIYSLDLCTATMDDAFFSYRKNKNCGRQASIIWIE